MSPSLKRRQTKLLKMLAEVDAKNKKASTSTVLTSVFEAISKISAIHPGSVTVEELVDTLSMHKHALTK